MRFAIAAGLLASSFAAAAAPLGPPAFPGSVRMESGEITVNGAPVTVVRYTWVDSAFRTRSAALVPAGGANAGHAVRFTYEVDEGGVSRTVNVDADPAGDGGFGYFVSHELYRTFAGGGEGTIAALHGEDDSPLGRYLPSAGSDANMANAIPGFSFDSARAVHEFRLLYPRWGTVASVPDPSSGTISPSFADHQKFMVPVTIRWSFADYQDYPLWSVEVNLEGMDDKVAMDVRGPYGVMRFNDGVGPAVTALRWGDRYRFVADANGADIGAAALVSPGQPWSWFIANPGRRYNGLAAGAYEFGLVDTVPVLASKYADGYANSRGGGGTAGCDYGLRALPCDWEWAYQSFQYDYGPPARPKLAWGSAPFLGSSLTSAHNGVESIPFSGKGRISYGVHVVFGRGSGNGALLQSHAGRAPEPDRKLELRVAPKQGGTASYRVMGDAAVHVDRHRTLPAWASVKATAAPAPGYELVAFDSDCALNHPPGSSCPERACAYSTPECRFAMDRDLSTVAVFALPGTTLYTQPAYLDMQQVRGQPLPVRNLFVFSAAAAAGKSVAVASSSPEFVVSQPLVGRPCSLGHDGANLACHVEVQFRPQSGPARMVLGTLTITSNQSAPVTVDLEGVAPASSVSMDLDGQGMSDLLWHHPATGLVWRLGMNGFTVTSSEGVYHEPDTQWRIVAEGDFNADGTADLVWRHAGDGRVYVMPFGTNGRPLGGAVIHTEANPAWRIVHSPDLDGDGRSDLLWWNSTTGQVYAMFMNGATVAAQGFVHHEPDTQWRIAAVGAFTQPGTRNELLWQHHGDGRLYVMRVGAGLSTTGRFIYQEPNTAWKVAGAADFNGDGFTDILWRNTATGQVYGMLVGSNGAITAQGPIHAEPNMAWQVVALGDYDGDGKADLMWHNASLGRAWLMRMNGLSIAAQGQVHEHADLQWKLLGPGVQPQGAVP